MKRSPAGLAVAFLGACKDDGSGPTSTYGLECEVEEPDDLADPFASLEGHEHDCEDGTYYNPAIPTATTYFVGEFHLDDCGNVAGRETWVLWPNEVWRNLGGKACEVVWTATGTRQDRMNTGDYSLALSMVVDPEATTCSEVPDFEEFYEDTFGVTYDVEVVGGDSTFFFESGSVLGTGEGNGSHLTYVSGVNCKLF